MIIMKIKKFENFEYDSFKTKITKEYVNNYLQLQERISTLAFAIYEIENDEEYDEDGVIDWNDTWIEYLLTDDKITVSLLNLNGGGTSVDVPTLLVFEPDKLEEYYASKKYNI